jgi:hypothetical protein
MTFAMLLIGLLVGCEDTEEAEGTEGTTESTGVPTGGGGGGAATGGCDDPAYNPYAGTCVETFFVGCFDPEGDCAGTYDLQGNVDLEWSNGAAVTTEVDMSDPFNIVAYTTLWSSGGDECVTGVTEMMQGDCASETIYDNGAEQVVFCAAMDGGLTVSCPDGSTVTVDASQAEAAAECQYGGGECEMSQG